MLAVTAFWSDGSCRVDHVSLETISVVPEAWIKKFPPYAERIDQDIKNGSLTEPGYYVFVEDETGTLLGYEKV
jgi:hypothetical protein